MRLTSWELEASPGAPHSLTLLSHLMALSTSFLSLGSLLPFQGLSSIISRACRQIGVAMVPRSPPPQHSLRILPSRIPNVLQ